MYLLHKMKLRITFIFFMGFFSGMNLFGQQENHLIQKQEDYIYQIEKKLILGDKNALLEIAPYLDNKTKITIYLGYHIINSNLAEVAKGILDENCVFLDNEILFSKDITTKEFQKFLDQNFDQIYFSSYAQAFLLTPLEKRTIEFDVREVSEAKKNELINNSQKILDLEWVKSNQIDILIKNKDPKALLLTASELYKIRYRFNKSIYNQSEYVDLIRLLTGMDIATENEKKELTWFIEKDFYPNASLNLLIYFSNNYKNFKWNNKRKLFENKKISLNRLNKEELLFELLTSKNDSIAKDAFKQLTNCRVENVSRIAKQYEKSDIKVNYCLPTFPYRFLSQLVLLSDYCKNNNINLESSNELKMNIRLLESKLSFAERRKLEDEVIKSLTLDQITSFEYQCLLNEKSWELTYSSGRILDIFYSRNWNDLLSNEKYLKLYLKKSSLFKKLGIVGVCNDYLVKFKNPDDYTIGQLNLIDKKDLAVNQQIEYVKENSNIQYQKKIIEKKEFDSNRDFIVSNLETEFLNIKSDTIEKYENEVMNLLSKINYNQIGKALELIENVKFKTEWKYKYSFLQDDFGFFWVKNFDDVNNRLEFIKMYSKLTEYDFYSYYLNQSGIDYLNKDNSLNYDKIYELLKYDIVAAFVGGGGGKRDNEVYSLIKLLEINYKTTLGYPKKLCNSTGSYACYSEDRASDWMQFMKDKNLLKFKHNEPVSFNYE